MEDYLWWETTFDGRWPLMEDNIRWKTALNERQPSIENDLWWKTTFDGRRPSMEDNLRWKTPFIERRPSLQNNLCALVLFSLPKLLTIRSCFPLIFLTWNLIGNQRILSDNICVPKIFRIPKILSNSSPKSRLRSGTRSWLCFTPVTRRTRTRRTTPKYTRRKYPRNVNWSFTLKTKSCFSYSCCCCDNVNTYSNQLKLGQVCKFGVEFDKNKFGLIFD